MRYCGYSEFFHDSGLAFIDENGNIEFASHGERYSRIKNDPNLPDVMYDMIRDDDHVTFYEDPSIRLQNKKGKGSPLLSSTKKLNIIFDSLEYDDFISHHVSHAANGFYTRPWKSSEDTVILSIDGVGEEDSCVIFDHNFNPLNVWKDSRSLGYFYAQATKILGFRVLEEEYIVMGMAAYGEPTHAQEIIDYFYDRPANELATTSLSRGYKKFLRDIFLKIGKNNFAASIQKFAEYVIMERAQEARKYGSKLIFTGGCAQNIIACSMIKPLFDDMHVPVAPTDAGSALGAAAYSYGKVTGNTRINWEGPYLGYDIQREINPKEVAQHVIDHSYCGVANGRAEFGPRALGNRSLIADVRRETKSTVNKIKRRQQFRPFAPAVLAEFADQYFEGPMNEYMQYTSKALHDYKPVIHVDGTSRVQLVKPNCKSVIRQILEEYYELTGVPMLLNTSLKIRGMPIVNDEDDAKAFEEMYSVKVF